MRPTYGPFPRTRLTTHARFAAGWLVALCGLATGQTTWTGGGGTVLWIDPMNWSNGVPGATVDATIPTGTPTMPSTIAASGAACRTLTVHGSFTAAAGSPLAIHADLIVHALATVAGPAAVRFVGSGNNQQLRLDPSAVMTADVECAQSSHSNLYLSPLSGTTTALGGALTMSSGNMHVLAAGATVAGGFTFAGGTADGSDLFVSGNVLATATVPLTCVLRCRRDFTAVPGFTSNTAVVFDGTVPQTIASQPPGGGVTLKEWTITAGSSVATAEVVTSTGYNLLVDGTLTIAAGGRFEFLGSNEVYVRAAGRIQGAGELRFAGVGVNQQIRLDPNGVVAVDVECVQPATSNLYLSPLSGPTTVLGGDLILSSGNLQVLGTAAIVSGDMTFAGGTANGADVVVSGNFLATAAVPFTSPLRCRRDFVAVPGFTSTTVVFEGTVPQVIGSVTPGAGVTLRDWTIAGGSRVTTAEVVTTTGPNLFVDGTLAIAAGGRFDFTGGNELQVRATGRVEGAGSLRFIGVGVNQQLRLHATGVVDAGVECVQSATSNMYFSLLTGTATALGGSLVITSGNVNLLNPVHIAGNLTLSGGVVIGGPEFVVQGNVTANAAMLLTCPITCNGNWAAHPSFVPTHPITLGGSDRATVSTTASPGSNVNFATLVIRDGVRAAANSLHLVATAATIEPSGRLLAGPGASLSLANLPTLQGTIGAEAGGTLALQPGQSLTVAAGAGLSLVGTPDAPARFTGLGAGGYGLTIAGNLEAMNFVFEKMGPQGIVVQQTAILAPPPRDLRAGLFDNPATGLSAALLDLRRPAPTTFRYARFERTNGQGVFNVRCLGGQRNTFVNWSGAFAGTPFEVDPLALVDWAPGERTQVSSFSATPGPEKVTLRWTTGSEVDNDQYRVERGLSASGPFSVVNQQTPNGPGSYQFVDVPLTPRVTWHYRLVQRLTHGAFDVLATASATPWCATLPPHVLKVGGSGAFPTIQAAVDAVTVPGSILSVAAGAYPAFTIDAPPAGGMRILGDGSGTVTIDTTAAPVRIRNLALTDVVELSDLSIGSGSSSHPGIVLQSSLGTVVLDELTVLGGTGQPAIRVESTIRLAVQGTTMLGSPGLHATASALTASRGSLNSVELYAATQATLVQLVPGSRLVDGGSVLREPTGVMPDLRFPEFPGLTAPFRFDYSGFPGSIWLLLLGLNLSYVDLTGLSDSPLLIDPGFFVLFTVQATDGAGAGTFPCVVPPDCALIGAPLPFQAVSVELPSLRMRFSNAATLVPVP